MATPEPRPGILEIKPYKPGASKAAHAGPIHKLSSNESALGASPHAIEAFRTLSHSLHLYPDGSATALREALGERWKLNPDRIVCGAGSDEILQLVTRAYAGPGDNIVQSQHGFLVYALAAKSCGAEVRFAAEKDRTADIDEILSQVDDATKLVFIANPNNPTGTYVPETSLVRLRRDLPKDVILVIDAAYAEYMTAKDYSDGAEMVDAHDNVVMTRTFSKIYGLGGLRLGWGYFPEAMADVINRIRGPFNVSAASIAAGVAAVNDTDFLATNRAHNDAERARLTQAINGAGLTVTPSVANFLLVDFPTEGKHTAPAALAFLASRGVLVREMTAYGLPESLRVSVGSREANDAFLNALEAFLTNG
ncbi:MAG: histidinol-phosphate transaminase [Pseudomonadota bacterium]